MTKQLLHMVFGGELNDLEEADFKDLSALDVVGFYPSYGEAHKAWLGKARETIDNAQMRYFIVHLHRLLDPDSAKTKVTATASHPAAAGPADKR